MPLPLILGVGAAIAGITGVGSGIHGAAKMKEANDTMKAADSRHKENIAKLERSNNSTNKRMDELGKLELSILNEFGKFADTIEKIQNRPKFKEYNKEGISLPKYDKEELNLSPGQNNSKNLKKARVYRISRHFLKWYPDGKNKQKMERLATH